MSPVHIAAELRDYARRWRRSLTIPGTPRSLVAAHELLIRELEAKADELDPPRRQKVTSYAIAPVHGRGRIVMVQHKRGGFGL